MTKFECVVSDAHLVPEVISGKGRRPRSGPGRERLAELKRSEKEQSAETVQEFEFCARLEKQPEAQEALESELLAKMETLSRVCT